MLVSTVLVSRVRTSGAKASGASAGRQTADGRRQTADGRRQTADSRRSTVDVGRQNVRPPNPSGGESCAWLTDQGRPPTTSPYWGTAKDGGRAERCGGARARAGAANRA